MFSLLKVYGLLHTSMFILYFKLSTVYAFGCWPVENVLCRVRTVCTWYILFKKRVRVTSYECRAYVLLRMRVRCACCGECVSCVRAAMNACLCTCCGVCVPFTCCGECVPCTYCCVCVPCTCCGVCVPCACCGVCVTCVSCNSHMCAYAPACAWGTCAWEAAASVLYGVQFIILYAECRADVVGNNYKVLGGWDTAHASTLNVEYVVDATCVYHECKVRGRCVTSSFSLLLGASVSASKHFILYQFVEYNNS